MGEEGSRGHEEEGGRTREERKGEKRKTNILIVLDNTQEQCVKPLLNTSF